jgi:hypothetical protein
MKKYLILFLISTLSTVILAETYSSLSITGKSTFGSAGSIADESMIKIKQSSNTEWGAIISNNGGNGRGVLIQAGSYSEQNIQCLDVRDFAGNSRFLVNSNGTVKIPGDVTLGTGWDGPFGESAMVKIRQSHNTNWSAIITNGGGSGKGLLISSGSPGNSDVSCLEVKDASYYTTRFYVRSNGNTYIQNSLTIGTTTALTVDEVTAKLTVKGLIAATELKVRPDSLFPDYVFDEGYKLTPLSELKTKIKRDKHLPGIPTAKDVEKKGLALEICK